MKRVLMLFLMLGLTCLAAEPDTKKKEETKTTEESPSRISDQQIPLDVNRFPQRPRPPIEFGDKILGQGPINKGITIPTGATWQPSLWAFGSWRTAVQSFDAGDTRTSEAATRMDLFTNLRLSGTERIVLGVRPFDRDGHFTRYQWDPDSNDGWQDESNLEVERLYFEGDFSELFPTAGRHGGQPRQLGFVLGRQPLFIQEGIMINDSLDAFGMTRNNIVVPGTSNFRVSALAAWNQVNRGDNKEDDSAALLGVFTEWDRFSHTYNVDLAYISADETTGGGTYLGVSRRGNEGGYNTQISVNASMANDEETAAVGNGLLIFGELSFNQMGSDNLIYLNSFVAIDRYTSASRGPANGGPLGRLGLLYASVGLGGYKAALSNQAGEAVGFSAGYQHFFNVRRQLIVELGARTDTNGSDASAAALGLRFQQGFGQHLILQADAFGAWVEKGDEKYGSRLELNYKF